jgi:hypothetical protein
MPTYTLELSISQTDLETIEGAGENIIVAKPVNSPDGTPNVAWLSIKPLEGNQIVWTEEYAMYASTSQIQSGASIFQTSTTPYPAEDGVCYQFDAHGTFPGQIAAPQPVAGGSYSILNDYTAQKAMTFGLTQSATTTNGNYHLSPLNAQSVPSQQQVVFTPFTTVWVWLETQVSSGVVLTSVFSKVAVVTFGGSATTQALTYDDTHGQFEPSSGSSNVRMLDFTKYGGGRRARKLR